MRRQLVRTSFTAALARCRLLGRLRSASPSFVVEGMQLLIGTSTQLDECLGKAEPVGWLPFVVMCTIRHRAVKAQ